MKRIHIITMSLVCCFLFTACNRTSVSDLQMTINSNDIREATTISETHGSSQGSLQGNSQTSGGRVDLNVVVQNSDLVVYGKLGESYRIGSFSFCIQQVVFSDTLEDLSQLLNEEDKNLFINYVSNVMDYDHYTYNGMKLKDERYIICFMKVKVKNETSSTIKQFLAPHFFSKNEQGFINCFGSLEAYNKYPDLTKYLKDANFFTFKPYEEIETVMCIKMHKSSIENEKIYLNTGNLINDNNINKLAVGSYMIPIN